MKRFFIYLFIIIFILFLYGHYVETFNIKTHEYSLEIKNAPESFKDLKIIHFSDILYNPKDSKDILEKTIETINNENADLVIFSGDLFGENKLNKEDYTYLKGLLGSIDASLYKIAVYGDNDLKNKDKYKEIMDESEFILLDNDNKLLFYKDNTPINVIGLSNLDNIDELLITDVETNYNIVITHKPDLFKDLADKNIDLVLSGHSLGGIIYVPYYGGVIKKDGANIYTNGTYKLNDSTLFINNGIGYEKFNYRLFNTPSINIYRFE